MHPRETDDPARDPDPSKREDDHAYHIWHLWRLRCQAIVYAASTAKCGEKMPSPCSGGLLVAP